MSRLTTVVLPLSLVVIVLALVVGAIAFAVSASAGPDDGPFDVVWDKAACAACGMHVGEPPFAAQLTTTDGRTYAFDDPGCLFLFVAEQRPDVHSSFFRHHREARWIPAADVAFLPVDTSPMGFGLAAVTAGTAGAIDLDAARRRCLDRASGHGERR